MDNPSPVALVFDLDGTLIDSAPDIHATANKVLVPRGFAPVPFEVVRSFIGNGVGVLVSRLLRHHGQEGDGPLQAAIVAEFIQIYEDAFDLTRLYPGVNQALAALDDAGHPMGICTNKPEGPARAALRHFGLDRYMQVVIGGDSLSTRKPHPAPLQAAVAALGARTAIFVGDSEVDAETACAANLPFALFTEGYRTSEVHLMSAKLIFGDFAALPGLVAHYSGRL